ncbi:hypothetical protein M413DRAFT_444842 [Hebeloma cylindrosporum]|uniref:FHA domain-containing protein n=1 Tax=Hebeloma cylindrosporum TaxID=76867 RepID=A0A0C3CDX7_HEBCY|nr:hypothetical protein M413DRAFT_444842 [Hebeloma cylindrosporum h7]
MSSPTVTLSPASGTFPFPSTCGWRVPCSSNGWFPPKDTEDNAIPSVSPLPLSSSHAEIWQDGGKIYIRDLESAFGTFVNGLRISKGTVLKTGDTISLGSRIARNDKTPAYITEFHLCPVIAQVSLAGVSA